MSGCICVFVFLFICIFVKLCICVFVPNQAFLLRHPCWQVYVAGFVKTTVLTDLTIPQLAAGGLIGNSKKDSSNKICMTKPIG